MNLAEQQITELSSEMSLSRMLASFLGARMVQNHRFVQPISTLELSLPPKHLCNLKHSHLLTGLGAQADFQPNAADLELMPTCASPFIQLLEASKGDESKMLLHLHWGTLQGWLNTRDSYAPSLLQASVHLKGLNVASYWCPAAPRCILALLINHDLDTFAKLPGEV